jgi:hypothetical protein
MEANLKLKSKRDPSTKSLVYKSAGERIGEGDTELLLDFLPPELAEVAFEKLRKEVAWNVMLHHGLSLFVLLL